MPDYIYLLENRLSVVQQNALRTVRNLAREAQMTVFLTGGAVRDLTGGSPVRDLEVVVNADALSLKSALERAGGKIWGQDPQSRTLYLCFPGSVRLDLRSARRAEYPQPGQPAYQWTNIQEDLRARDFTINAMAISLNEGSYGLLMDPSNGVADIEARLLRLVSNYGFLNDPALLVRATRLKARLGFELEERTHTRYENAKGDEVIQYLSDTERARELEQIGHEEEPLKVLEALEAEGWMQPLFPAWTAAKADVEKLTALHDLANELQVQGVHPDVSAAQMQLLTARLTAKELAQLKKQLLRPGFVEEWNNLDAQAAEFAKILLSKANAAPSATFNLFTTYAAEAVLWLGFTSKQAAVREKYDNFLKVWPQARQRIPYALMQELRITAELPGYQELVKSIFLQLIDGGLTTGEEMRALLEPLSPPAPPPPVTIKRTRAKKGADAKAKARLDDDEEESEETDEEVEDDEEDDLDGLDLGTDDLDLTLGLDDVRADLPVAEGEEDDVFARSSVGDEELDTELDPDVDDEADGDSDNETPRPTRKAGRKKGSRSDATLESEDDPVTAAGAGLKALALKLDLEEFSDPADLDEADPVIDLEEPPAPRAAKKQPAKSKAHAAPPPAPKKAAKAAPAKAVPVKHKHAPAKIVPVKTAHAKPAPAKSAHAKPAHAKPAPAKPAPAKPAPKKAAKSAPARPAPARHAPAKASKAAKAAKPAPAKGAKAKSAKKR